MRPLNEIVRDNARAAVKAAAQRGQPYVFDRPEIVDLQLRAALPAELPPLPMDYTPPGWACRLTVVVAKDNCYAPAAINPVEFLDNLELETGYALLGQDANTVTIGVYDRTGNTPPCNEPARLAY